MKGEMSLYFYIATRSAGNHVIHDIISGNRTTYASFKDWKTEMERANSFGNKYDNYHNVDHHGEVYSNIPADSNYIVVSFDKVKLEGTLRYYSHSTIENGTDPVVLKFDNFKAFNEYVRTNSKALKLSIDEEDMIVYSSR